MPGTTLSLNAPPAETPHRSGIVLATLLTCQLMIVLDATVMNVALPRIQSDLRFSPAGLSWVLNAYTLVFGGLLLLGGRAGDLFGRRRVFMAGVALFTAASLAGGLAESSTWLLVTRVLQGVGGAAAGPSTLALLTTTFTEPRERVRALSLFSGMSSAGFAVGLILGGLLTQWLSWRAVMFINVPFGIAILVFASAHLREPERHPARLDLLGAITATGGVGALVYGFIHAASSGWGHSSTMVWVLVGVLLLAAFVVVQLRSEHPMMPPRLFADRTRLKAYLNFWLGPMAGMSMFFFLSQYLQEVNGLNALGTGFAFLPMAVLIFTMTRLMPRLLPRVGPKRLAVVGTALMVIGLALLTGLGVHSAYFPTLFVSMALIGIGMGLAFSPLNVMIMGTIQARDAGAAGGVLQTMQQLGATLGLAILVTVFGSATRGVTGPAPQILVTGMTAAFVASALIAGVTFLVALTFPRKLAQ